jgi:hypothetical protein
MPSFRTNHQGTRDLSISTKEMKQKVKPKLLSTQHIRQHQLQHLTPNTLHKLLNKLAVKHHTRLSN